jgi:hypothetical protein
LFCSRRNVDSCIVLDSFAGGLRDEGGACVEPRKPRQSRSEARVRYLPLFRMPGEDNVHSTIQDLNLYVRVKRKSQTYVLYVTQETTARDIKRMMRQFTQRKIHDIHFVVPRYGNRKFHDRLSFEQMILQNGEVLLMQLRKPGTDDYETVEEVTGEFDTIGLALER